MLATDVIDAYFVAVKSHSVEKIIALFAEDAMITTQEGDIVGKKDIQTFYLNGVLKCEEFEPRHGPYFISRDNSVAVEIDLVCDGVVKRVGDFFTVKDNKITHMRVYSGRGYTPRLN